MSSARALVVGATGGFGAAMTRELAARDFAVRAHGRTRARLERVFGDTPNVEPAPGDAQNDTAVMAAAQGCDVVVHAANLPYARWIPDMEYITSTVVRAARANHATLLFPGNVYGFGHQTGRPLPETAPMRPDTKKGTLRVQLESILKSATTDGDLRVLVVRAGDFFGPTVRNGLVDRIFGRAAAGRSIRTIGRPDVPHQWAYVPDLARLAADLLERRSELAPYEVVHYKGHVAEPNEAFLRAVAGAAGHPDLEIETTPWWLLRLTGVVDPQIRELMELRYLFDDAVILDDPRRRELLPHFVDTPLESAIAATLGAYRGDALR